MKKLLLSLVLLVALNAYAQKDMEGDEAPFNKFSISVLSPLQFNYTSTLDLFQQKVIQNAIQLDMKVKQESIGVFGQVRFFTNNVSAFANKMALRMKYTNSPDASSSSGDVLLTANPALLVTQPGGQRSVKQYKYLFDLKLHPPDTFEGLEDQNFSIIYTISIL